MMYARTNPRGGLGDAQRAAIIESGISTGLMTAGMLSPEPISKAVLLAAAGLTSLVGRLFRGCGASCIAATQVVDQVEPALKQNVLGYLEGPRTMADQRHALAAFDYAWSEVVRACSNPALGDAGRRCISERDRGGRPSWGANWFELYRDPIANDTPTDTGTFSGAAGALIDNPDLALTPEYSSVLLPLGLLAAGLLI